MMHREDSTSIVEGMDAITGIARDHSSMHKFISMPETAPWLYQALLHSQQPGNHH
jgi:hypothetical protein